MRFTCKTLNRRDNNAVIIAICCSYPWLFSSSNTHHSSHPILAMIAAVALILAAGFVANYICRKRRTAA